jgi:hypothetical protein
LKTLGIVVGVQVAGPSLGDGAIVVGGVGVSSGAPSVGGGGCGGAGAAGWLWTSQPFESVCPRGNAAACAAGARARSAATDARASLTRTSP